MNKSKQKRLESAGFQLGSAKDFLGLSDEEAAFVEMKLALSRRLREQRKRLKVSQGSLAERIGSSQSRVAKMEAADPSVSLDLLVRALLASGASPSDVAKSLVPSK